MTTSDPVFVTGAAGFVGSRLVERLRELGRPTHALIRDGARRTHAGAARRPRFSSAT